MLSKLTPRLNVSSLRSFSKHLKAFATVDPNNLSDKDKGYNLVKGNWTTTKEYKDLVDPMTGQVIMKYPST